MSIEHLVIKTNKMTQPGAHPEKSEATPISSTEELRNKIRRVLERLGVSRKHTPIAEAQSRRTTPTRLIELSGHEDLEVRKAAVVNPNMPLEIRSLIALTLDENWDVRCAAGMSKRMPPSIYMELVAEALGRGTGEGNPLEGYEVRINQNG